MAKENTTVAEYKRRRELWSRALLSGEFEQGYGAMCRGDEFCCLGVACEVYSRDTGRGYWVDSGDGRFGFLPEGDPIGEEKEYHLPEVVRDWYGLWTGEGHYVIDRPSSADYPRSLAKVNDSRAYSFQRIADLLRDRYLFTWTEEE